MTDSSQNRMNTLHNVSAAAQVAASDGSLRLPSGARELLGAMINIYKYDLSDAEAVLWEHEVFSRYPEEQIMRALKAHMESGKPDAKFMPRYGEIKKMLEPTGGFAQVVQAVRDAGPYAQPDISDPVLLAAIHQMGGWATVCAELPDGRENPIEFDRYMKRFDVALAFARTAIRVQGVLPPPLTAIGQQRIDAGNSKLEKVRT